MITAYAFQLGTLPMQLRCYNDGSISFLRMQDFATIIDSPEGGPQTIISNQDILVAGKTEIGYNVRYDFNEPHLKEWLVTFNLEVPQFN